MENPFEEMKKKLESILKCSCGSYQFKPDIAIFTGRLICKKCGKVYHFSK